MTNKYLTLKIIYGILFLIIPSLVFSQNALRSGDGWGSGWSNNDFFSATGFGNTFGKTYQNTSGAGNRYFRLFTSWNSQNREHGPSGANDIQVSIGSPINLETGSSKAYFINVANSSNNYVFRTPNGDGISNTPRLVVFEIQGSVRSISSVSQLPTASNVKSCNQVTITANTGTNLPNGQGVYLRYATSSNFANSVVVPMTNSSTGNYSGTIPAQPVGTTVNYYLFTSGSGLTISPTDSDWFTINGNNNNGSNYSYTVGTPNLTASITNNSPSVCLGSSISLNSNTAVTYAWSGPNSFTSSSQNVDITNASVNNGGTYTLTVSDGYGCSATATTEVVVNANPSPTAGSNSPVCVGNSINLTSNSASGNVWTGPNSFSSTLQNPVINSSSSANTGIYTLMVTDVNGCSATATTEVVVNANPSPTVGSYSPVCVGNSINLTSNSASGNVWIGPNSFSSTLQNPVINSASSANAGIYTLTVTDSNGCSATATTEVVVNANPNPVAGSNSPVCVGTTINLTSNSASGNAWTGPNSFSSTQQNPVINSASSQNAGIYTLTVTDASGCSATATTEVVVNANPSITAGSNSPVCAGKAINLTSNISTGNSWVGPNSFSSTQQNPVINSASSSNSGVYTLTVTNAYGCSATATTEVIVNANPSPTAGSNSPVCTGKAINLTSNAVSGNVWTGPNSFSSTLQNPVINSASSSNSGVYTLTVTNAYGCSATATTEVIVNANPSPTAGSNSPVCVGNAINLTSNSASGNVWTGPNSFSSTLQNPVINSSISANAGIYTLTVTDVNGCSTTATTEVVVNANPSPEAGSNSPVCAGNAINLTSNSASGNVWTGPNSFSSTLQNPVINSAVSANAGIYTLTVTDANGCSATATTEVIVNANPSITAGSNSPVCVGTTINLTSNAASGNVWTGPNSFSSTQQNPVINSASSQNAGIYTLTVTDANGCSATATNEVIVNANPSPTAGSNSPVCTGKAINLTSNSASGNVWTGPNSFSSTLQNPVINSAVSANVGVYTLTVTDANGCSATATTEVIVNANPSLTAGRNSPVCVGNAINLTSNSASGNAWTGPNSFSSTQQNPVINSASSSNSGVYTLTVTDANSCSATATTEVVVNAKPAKPTISATSSSVCNGGSVILTASSCDGGQGSLKWTDGLTGTSITISPTNTKSYRVLCISAAGCDSDSSDATLISVVPIPSTPNVSSVVIRVGTSTSLTATCSSGTPVWYASSISTTSLGTSTYTTPILNSNTTYFVACESNPIGNPNCVSSRVQQIVQVDNFAITTQPQNRAICAAQATSFSVAADGTNISYQWQVNSGSGWVNISNNTTYSGANLVTLLISSASLSMNSYQYRCILTNGLVNGTPATSTSNIASLTVLTSSSGNNLTITNAINSTNTIIQAGQTIIATNSITGASRVEYLAGNAVLLNPGFVVTAASGSSFQAKMQAACQN